MYFASYVEGATTLSLWEQRLVAPPAILTIYELIKFLSLVLIVVPKAIYTKLHRH